MVNGLADRGNESSLGGVVMSLEDDILAAVLDRIQRAKEWIAYAGKVNALDTTNNVVSVIVDGSTGDIPAKPLTHDDLAVGRRVIVLKAGETWYVVGVIGNKRVVSLPPYSGTHPTGTSPGDMWYRSDLNQGFINLNGTPTSLT